ncbi:MAG TPA: hypothetical protein VFA75_20885 [Nevskia sp.]|nr:hypothetical protein [Nevskia sp.]
MTTRQAWHGLGTSARNTLAWARGLYRAARAPHSAAAAVARLEHAQWLCASAEACVEEAQRLYVEGLESLLLTGVSVQPRQAESGRSLACRPLDDAGAGAVLFEDGQPRPAEPALLERIFGRAGEDLLRAFGLGLHRLDALGMFATPAPLLLRPDLPARSPRPDPAEPPRRRPSAASRSFRTRPAASPTLPLRPV